MSEERLKRSRTMSEVNQPNRLVSVTEWFNCEDREHAEAWLHLCRTGTWPEGFIPDFIELSPQWQVSLGMLMANRWAQHIVNKDVTGRRKVDMRHDYMKYDGRPPEPPYDTEAAPSSCTVDSIVLCPVCQRGDVWQEAVNRTEYVYNGEAVKDGQEVIAYLLAEVATLLETQNVEAETLTRSEE